MVLIIGGAYQGKTDYAKEHYRERRRIDDFQEIVKEQMNRQVNTKDYFAEQIENYQDAVIICDDISCGIVPMDPNERAFREELGHVLAIISRHAEEVIRVFCGIGTKIK